MIFLCCTIASCGNTTDNNDQIDCPNFADSITLPQTCSIGEINEYVFNIMNDVYLWSDQITVTDFSEFSSLDDLFQALIYKNLDKWSYITTKENYESYYDAGKTLGFGLALKFDANQNLRLTFVFENSPAGIVGLERGDQLIEINNLPIDEVTNNDLWDSVFGINEAGIEVQLKIRHLDESITDYTLAKEWFVMNTVLYSNIINHNDFKIGHIVFKAFLETSRAELDSVFNNFKRNEIDELILDLRYNTGGRSTVSQYLANLVAGTKTGGEIFSIKKYNDKYECQNKTSKYSPLPNSIDLNRVFIITTNKTASACESLINGLKPFIDVVVIGDTTRGKPVGMRGYEFCNKIINPISYKIVNSNDEGDYFDGITPLCFSNDDITKPFNDIEEDSLKKTLYYIKNGHCEAQTTKGHSKSLPDKTILKGFRSVTGVF